ncbi:MAG: hypothetical protein WAM28_08225 [Chlamydiales bacterium]
MAASTVNLPAAPHVSIFLPEKVQDDKKDSPKEKRRKDKLRADIQGRTNDFIITAREMLALNPNPLVFKASFLLTEGRHGGVYSALYPDAQGMEEINNLCNLIVQQNGGVNAGRRTTSTHSENFHITLGQAIDGATQEKLAALKVEASVQSSSATLKKARAKSKKPKRKSPETRSLLPATARELIEYGLQNNLPEVEGIGRDAKLLEGKFRVVSVDPFGGWVGARVVPVEG